MACKWNNMCFHSLWVKMSYIHRLQLPSDRSCVECGDPKFVIDGLEMWWFFLAITVFNLVGFVIQSESITQINIVTPKILGKFN